MPLGNPAGLAGETTLLKFRAGILFTLFILLTLLGGGSADETLFACNAEPYTESKRYEIVSSDIEIPGTWSGPCLTFAGDDSTIFFDGSIWTAASVQPKVAVKVTGKRVNVEYAFTRNALLLIEGEYCTLTSPFLINSNFIGSQQVIPLSITANYVTVTLAQLGGWLAPNFIGISVENAVNVTIDVIMHGLNPTVAATSIFAQFVNVHDSSITLKGEGAFSGATDTVVGVRVDKSKRMKVDFENTGRLNGKSLVGVSVLNSDAIHVNTDIDGFTSSVDCFAVNVFESNNTVVTGSINDISTSGGEVSGIKVERSTNTTILDVTIRDIRSTTALTGIKMLASMNTAVREADIVLAGASSTAVHSEGAGSSDIRDSSLEVPEGRGMYFSPSFTAIIFAENEITAALPVVSQHHSGICSGIVETADSNHLCFPPYVGPESPLGCCSSLCVRSDSAQACRSSTGACDKAEFCSGLSSLCPDDQLQPSNHPCSDSPGPCGGQSYCTGNSTACLAEPACPDGQCNLASNQCECALSGYEYPHCLHCVNDSCSQGLCNNASSLCECSRPGYIYPHCQSCAAGSCPSGSCNATSLECECSRVGYSYPHCQACEVGSCSLGPCNTSTLACECSRAGYMYPHCQSCEAASCSEGVCNTTSRECECSQAGYTYPHCQACQPGSCSLGTCNTATGNCECSTTGYTYPHCQTCQPGSCSLGTCNADNGKCECSQAGYTYPHCQACEVGSCSLGACNTTKGECECSKAGYKYPHCQACEVGTCTEGACNTTKGECECSKAGYTYPHCQTCSTGSCQAGGVCTLGVCQCPDNRFTFPRCQPVCGDGFCDFGENSTCFSDCYPTCTKQNCIPGQACCDSNCGFANSTLLCNNAADICEQSSYCSGTSAVCPPKVLRPTTYLCRKGVTPCDADEYCTGTAIRCPQDIPAAMGTPCNISFVACTPNAKCDGETKICPPIIPQPCPSYCGDGTCDFDETCNNCTFDCHCVQPCPGTPECSNRGTCRSGVCLCNEGYTGARCSDVSVPVVIVHNTTTTTIQVPGGNNNNGTSGEPTVTFRVGISRIFEQTASKQMRTNYTLAGREFNATYENLTSSERFNTTISFPNKAVLEYSSWIFHEAQTVSFGNVSIPVTNFTVKNIVDIRNWIFETITNQLVIEYEMVLETEDKDACTSTNVQVDTNDNVYYFTISSGGVSLYCQLVDTIILDERIKRAQFKIEDKNKLQVITPHFWDSVVVDPNFAVLLQDNKDDYNNPDSHCLDEQNSSKGTSIDGKLVAMIVAPVVGVLVLILIAVTVVYPRVSTWYQLKRGAQHMIDRDLDEIQHHDPNFHHGGGGGGHHGSGIIGGGRPREPVIELMQDMEVTTSAGRFVVKMQ